MAEVAAVDEEEETTVARPLPMGLAELGTRTVSRWEDGAADDAVCSNGEGVMFARAGG